MSTKFSVNDTSATTQAYFLIRGMGYNELARQIRKGEATVLSALESILKLNGYGWTFVAGKGWENVSINREKMNNYNRVQFWLMRDAFNEVQSEQGVSYNDRRYATPESMEL